MANEDIKTEDSQKRKPEDEKAPKQKLSGKEKRAQQAELSKRCKEIHAKRKELKKELRLTGIRNRADFESVAEDLDLCYPDGTLRGLYAKTAAKVSRVASIVKAQFTIKSALVILAVLLAATFMIAYISEEKGHFTINLTADMMREGFIISNTEDFNSPSTRLFADEIVNSNPTSLYEINRRVNQVDGSHNGPGYLAYTWYIKNGGQYPTDYGYTVNILSETMGTAKSAWLMFFEDDKQIMYAHCIEKEDGTIAPENLWGYPQAPFIESAYAPDEQYYQENGKWGVITTPFIDNETALQGYVKNFQPGDVKKYTCVVWLEGDDPDCNNSILGGHVGFNIQYDRLGQEDTSYFKGLFRIEYKEYYQGNTMYEYQKDHREGGKEAHETEGQTEEVTYYDVDVPTEAIDKIEPESEAAKEEISQTEPSGEQ